MKRYGMFRFLALSLLLGWSEVSLCATVSSETAAKVGLAFAQQNAIIKDSVTGVGTPYAFGKRWVVPLEPSGYVLLESDDTLKPVVAFATTDFPDLTGAPEGLIAFFSGEEITDTSATTAFEDLEEDASTEEDEASTVSVMSDFGISMTELSLGDGSEALSTTSTQSEAAASDTDTSSSEAGDTETSASEQHGDWSLLLESLEDETSSANSGIMLMSDSVTVGGTTVEVANIKNLTLSTAWNQCLPYNLYAPGLTEVVGTGYGGSYGWRGAAGCVAIAEAQIAAYLRWPYRLHGTYHLNSGGNTGHLAHHQAVAPGNPYDWNAINSYVHSGCNEEPYGNEVARLIQHWATTTDMYYQRVGGGGTDYWCANAKLPILGYQSVSISGSTAYSRLRTAIYDYAIPVAVNIPSHAVVGAGWAEEVDNVLSADTCYAYLNYGWGGGTTWYTVSNAGIGNTTIRLPLPYGEVTEASGTKVTWYESPWWTTRHEIGTLENVTDRTLRRVAIAGATTDSQSVDLSALASSNSTYWTYDASGLTRNIVVDTTASATASDYFTGGTSVTFALTRRDDSTESAETWEASGSTLTFQALSLWDDTVLLERQVQMASTSTVKETVTIDLSGMNQETPWKLVLVTSASSTEAVASIPYYITDISVLGAFDTTDETVTFDVTEEVTSGTCVASSDTVGLYTRTCSDLSTLTTGDRAFYALQIGDTDDWIWSQCLTEAAPTITWTNEIGEKTTETDGWRFWLPTPETKVTFNISDTDSTAITNVTAYLSNALWIDPATLTSSDGMGIVLPVDELTQTATIDDTGTNTWSCAFTFTPNPNDIEDTMSLNSSTAVGRDAVLSIKVVDAEGNVGWSHARMTFGVTKGSLATTSGEVSTTNATARTTDILLSAIRRTYIGLDFSEIAEAYYTALTKGQTEAEFRAAVFQKAVAAGVLPSPINTYTFDGSCSMTNGENLSYTDSPFGQAFQIVENSEPYGGHSMGAGNETWTASAVIYPTAQAPTGSDTNPGILWMYGSVNGSDYLTVTWTRADSEGNGTLGIYRNNASTCLATAKISATTWHLINIVYDGTTTDSTGATSPTLTIYVDGEAVTTVTSTDLNGALPSSSTGFQIGSGYGGLPSGFVKGYGIWMDDYRGWSVALAESQLETFWKTWKLDHVAGTLDTEATTLKLSELTWTKDSTTVDASTFTTNTVAQVTIPSTVTKFIVDNVPMNTLSLTGSGGLELEVADDASSGLKFIDTTLLGGSVTFGSGTHDLATTLYPGNTYTDGAGESGDPVGLSLTGGTISLTGGTFYWPETTSATSTIISVTNDVQMIAEDSLGVGEATYNFSGSSGFTATRLILSQGNAGRTAKMTLSENAKGAITGSSNVDTNQSSFMVGHWDGPSTLTLKDSATLTAENAEMLVAKTRNNQTINLEDDAILTVKGIKVSANATSGTRTLNLAGGELRLGSTGIAAHGSYTIDVNVTGNSTLTATASEVPITQPVTISADATWTIDGSSAGNTVTLSNTLTNNGTIAIAANGTLDISSATLSGSGTIDLTQGSLTIGSAKREIAASGTFGATIDITPTDAEVTAKQLEVTITGATADEITTSQVILSTSDGNRLPVTGVSFSGNTLTVSIGETTTYDVSAQTSFPISLTGISGVSLTNSSTPARAFVAFTSDTKLLALPDVENAEWSEAVSNGTYTYTLTPTATELPDALTTWSFDGVDPGTTDSATMTFDRSLPDLDQAGVLGSPYVTGTSSDLTGSWTVTLMVLPTATPQGDKTIILNFGAEVQFGDIYLTWNTNADGDTSTGTFSVENGIKSNILTSKTCNAAQWHAVTMTYDDMAKKLYLTVDDTEEVSYDTGSSSLDLPSAFSFGSGYTELPLFGTYGDGHRVDQVIRWDSALTTAQLEAAYAEYENTYVLYVDNTTFVSTSSVTKLFEPSTSMDASTLDASTDTLWLLAFDEAAATWYIDENVTIPVKTHIESGTVTLARTTSGSTGVISSLSVLSDDATIVFDESQTAYVTTRELDPTTSTYLGTFKFVGGSADEPLTVSLKGTSANLDPGKYAIGANSWLNLHNAGSNKVYTVTGDDPETSILVLTSASDWGTTAQSATSFTNLTIRLPETLIDSTSANADFWIRPGSTSGVIIDTDRKVTLEDSYSDTSTAVTTTLTLAGLTGSGQLYATSAKTVDLQLVEDCTYSGSPSSNLTFVVSNHTLTLSGSSYPNPFTINAGGAVKFASSGTQTVSGVISGAGDLEIASGSVTLSKANTLTGTTTIAEGATLTLSGSVAGDIVLSGGTLKATNATAASNAISVSGSSVITGTVSGDITLAEGASLDLSGATFSSLPTLASSTATLILSSDQATSSDASYTIPSGMTVKVQLDSSVSLTENFTASSLSTDQNVIFILTNGQEVTGSGNVLVAGTTYTWATEATEAATYSWTEGAYWSTEDASGETVTGTVPPGNANIIIQVPSTGVTLDIPSAVGGVAFTVNAADSSDTTGTLKLTGDGSLSVTSATINVDTEVSTTGTSSLGTASIADGKTLTVGALTDVTKASGDGGTLKVTKSSTLSARSVLGDGTNLTFAGGVTHSITAASNGSGVGFVNDRIVTITGEGTTVTTPTSVGDISGYAASSGTSAIVITDGATFSLGRRDTLNAPVTLCNGTYELGASAGNSRRALDIYNNRTDYYDFTVNAASDATSDDPTVSYLTALDTTTNSANRIVSIRRGDLRVFVDTNAKFVIDADLSTSVSGGDYSNNGGALVKYGAGILELKGDNSGQAKATTINAGTLLLSGTGELGTGAVTIASGATLEISSTTTADLTSRLTNNGTLQIDTGATVQLAPTDSQTVAGTISGVGTLAITSGTVTLSGTTSGFTGTTVLSGSTLNVADEVASAVTVSGESTITGTASGVITLADGAVLDLTGATLNASPVLAEGATSATIRFGSTVTTLESGITIPTGVAVYVTIDDTIDLTKDFTVSGLALADGGKVTFILPNGEEEVGTGTTLSAAKTYTATLTTGENTWSTANWDRTITDLNAYDLVVLKVPSEGASLTVDASVIVAAVTVEPADTTASTAGTLTISVNSDASLSTSAMTANANVIATDDCVTWAELTIAADCTYTVNYSSVTTTARTLQTGFAANAGTFALTSSVTDDTVVVTLPVGVDTAAQATTLPAITVGEGVQLSFEEGQTFSGTYTFSVLNGGTLTIHENCTTLLNGTSTLSVAEGGVIEFTHAAAYGTTSDNFSGITGSGTIRFSGSGYRALPITVANMPSNDLTFENNVSSGLVLTNETGAYTIGSLSGSGSFRPDWNYKTSRTLTIVQSSNTTFSGALFTTDHPDRLAKVTVKHADGKTADNATLTLSGNTPSGQARPLTVEGSVKITGTYDGTITVSSGGTLELDNTVTLEASTFTNSGTLVVGTNGVVTLTSSLLDSFTSTVTNNGVLNIILSSDDYQNGYTCAKSGTGTVNFYAPSTTDVSTATPLEVTTDDTAGTVSWTSTPYVFTATTLSSDGTTYAWSEPSNWSTKAVPTEDDIVTIQLSADTTITLDTEVTVATLTIEAATDTTPTLTLAGSALTWGGTLSMNAGTLCFASSGATYSGAIDSTVNLATAAGASVTLSGLSGTHSGTIDLASGSTLTLNALTTQSGAITGAGTLVGSSLTSISGAITPNEGATLSISSSASALTLSGTLSGAGTLALPGTATVTISGTVTPNTTSGKTFTLAPSATTTISSTLSGSGSLSIGGTGTVTLTAGTNGSSFSGTINVLDGATIVGNCNGSFPFGGQNAKVIIASGGTLSTRQDCRFWGQITGEGNVEVPSGTFYVPGSGIGVSGTVTIASNATLHLSNPKGDGSYSTMANASVVVNGTLAYGTVTIPSGKTLSGSGTISSTLTFEDGATLDATSVLTASGTVTGSGVLSVTPPTTLSADTAIFKTSTDQTSTFLSTLVPTSDITSGFLKISSSGIVLQEMTVSDATVRDTTGASTTTTVTLDETSQAKILAAVGQQASDATAITSVTGETNTGAETATTLSETELEGALALFENIVTVTTTTTEASTTATAKVAYDFGVTAITVKSIGDDTCVVITAKVSNANENTSTAAFASGTTVTVTATDGDGTTKSITATEVTSEEGTTEGATSETGVKYFKVPLTELGDSGTVQFSVKASNSAE